MANEQEVLPGMTLEELIALAMQSALHGRIEEDLLPALRLSMQIAELRGRLDEAQEPNRKLRLRKRLAVLEATAKEQTK